MSKQMVYFDTVANGYTGILTVNSTVLVTNGSGVPSFSTSLPSGVTASSLTSVGALVAGSINWSGDIVTSGIIELSSVLGDKFRIYDGGVGMRVGFGINASEEQFYITNGSHFSFNGGGDLQVSGTNEWARIDSTGLSLLDTSAAYDVKITCTSSTALTAGRTLTLDMNNVAHTLALGSTANTITFPSAASYTVAGLSVANVFTAAQEIDNSVWPQLTLKGTGTASGGMLLDNAGGFGSRIRFKDNAGDHYQIILTNNLDFTLTNLVSGIDTLKNTAATGVTTIGGGGVSVVDASGVTTITGTQTNDDAAAGKVGEYISSTVLIGSEVTLTSNVTANVTSISLTAGDWDVNGTVYWDTTGTTVTTYLAGAINTTSATLPTAPGSGARFDLAINDTGTVGGLPTGTRRLSLSTTTTVYLVTLAVFTTSTCKAYGFIGARRAR